MKRKYKSRVQLSIITLIIAGLVTFYKDDINRFISHNIAKDDIGDSRLDSSFFHSYDLDNIPAYEGEPFVVINNNEPFFDEDDLKIDELETYSALDSLGRCGVAIAKVGIETMPTEPRGSISGIKPSGWHLVKYDNVDGKYLYNRCHLIGYQLTGENANENNLITCTRAMNTKGMLPFEDEVADYVKETKHHVLYRVTPIFEDDNLLASGVLMEAQSLEDDIIKFNIYVYNVQEGIVIDYKTGESKLQQD